MKLGIDILGAAAYPESQVVFDSVPKNWVLGVFAIEFLDVISFLRDAAKQGYRDFRVHLLWSHNNHNYGQIDFETAKDLAVDYEQFAKNHPHCHIEISPFCEHNLNNPDPWLTAIATIAPHCTIVNSPWQGAFSTKFKNEIHGNAHRPIHGAYNYSFDGLDAFTCNVRHTTQIMHDADTFFLWGPRLNLHTDMEDKLRDNPPDPVYIKRLISLI